MESSDTPARMRDFLENCFLVISSCSTKDLCPCAVALSIHCMARVDLSCPGRAASTPHSPSPNPPTALSRAATPEGINISSSRARASIHWWASASRSCPLISLRSWMDAAAL